ncbi:MAG TPA: D-alanine--D-alanine ligase [Candidatus Pseudogracilibacillus intestinigallinarum]|uniref:D-alanine--D-alanine ligase n=1 Tax=Candidatus Pseudogracilibacillus intestinigallinarum TaxID=2838742 RepID=A0A9D1PP79_9BACI|nr:D-alanine--D-alanine ligase [Candidatus Pseudogracilibacillus intestinigallinarum]
MKIAVLYGGVSNEREVSISSSKGIIEALEKNGHDVIGIDFHPERLQEVIELNVDLVFIGLHGKHGEDGCVQGLLDMLEIPYVGSGVMASSVAMNKFKAKQLFEQAGIPVAKGEQYRMDQETNIDEVVDHIHANFEFPFVIKPNREGSTVGLTIVRHENETKEAVKKAAENDLYILVEQFIKGKELTVPVLGEIHKEKSLPIIEIIPKNELYDYEAKYSVGGSEHIIPARIDKDITEKIQAYAVLAHQILGCETYSRADFLLTEEGIPYILEVNTLPGMTPTSLFPDAAKSIGISYEEMIEQFVQLSL